MEGVRPLYSNRLCDFSRSRPAAQRDRLAGGRALLTLSSIANDTLVDVSSFTLIRREPSSYQAVANLRQVAD